MNPIWILKSSSVLRMSWKRWASAQMEDSSAASSVQSPVNADGPGQLTHLEDFSWRTSIF